MRSRAVHVDIIHTSPVITRAIAHELLRQEPELKLGTVDYSWVRFAAAAFPAPLVVLDAYLDDHVPLALKVRALRIQGCQVVVLGAGATTPLARRALAEGATCWIEPTTGLRDTVADVLDVVRAAGTGPRTPAPFSPDLTQREIQVLALYAARRAPSVQQLSRSFGLSTETIRSHLRSGRSKYTALGRYVGNRPALAEELAADGILVPAATWAELHRW